MAENTERVSLTEAVFYILLSLYTPMHGYGVMQNISKMSGGRLNLGAGTLYGAINTLIEKQWIKSLSANIDSRKKEYIITDAGKNIVASEIVRLEELIKNGHAVTGGFN